MVAILHINTMQEIKRILVFIVPPKLKDASNKKKKYSRLPRSLRLCLVLEFL
jgi:hypothetical protein